MKDFTEDDWVEIAQASGVGFARGGIRGLAIYSLTNATATSAAAASSVVTASIGVAEQANRLRQGSITEAEFIEGAEFACLNAAMSALSSCVGQALIPIPVLGAVIGNTVGTVMYSAVASSLARQEVALIERHLAEQQALDERLTADYQDLLAQLDATITTYLAVLERAFSPDPRLALLASVELAKDMGVDHAVVLDTREKTRAYFLE